MVRWQPDARGRLGAAAMALYADHGYDETTVAEIAERAGLTSRTFFRYFGDKREVLFAGADELTHQLTSALATCPPGTPPLEAVVAALDVVTEFVGADRAHSRARQAIIDAHPDLRERELAKLASWSATLAEGLRERGVSEPDASLVAETAVAAFRVAFTQWRAASDDTSMSATLHGIFAQLRAISML